MHKVAAAVIQRSNTFLICQRPHEKLYGGLWEFPGGKVENGESAAQTLERELKEELGVDVVQITEVLGTVNDTQHGYEITFYSTRISGEPECREHILVKWASKGELALLPLVPNDTVVIQNLP